MARFPMLMMKCMIMIKQLCHEDDDEDDKDDNEISRQYVSDQLEPRALANNRRMQPPQEFQMFDEALFKTGNCPFLFIDMCAFFGSMVFYHVAQLF